MIITVSKIGTGTDDDPYRPDYNGDWQLVEERENEFVIETL
ncbi:hypothetical protein SAMN04487969_10644 [Paenibacillus algorifonticola]|uniref:Uncharacterized protein n=1 Tax=Paenibacillus algorifonticola TaxID=684063 RepID=A0A1I2D1I8_9BACL|nr:hypothetical protein [Paenibacillus algorifonticola]SFE74381.1 hypothetical protein SAMN04487969_10644 [Paenibacillus algorifonticola]